MVGEPASNAGRGSYSISSWIAWATVSPGSPEGDGPQALDLLDFTDRGAAVELLRSAPLRVPYHLFLPSRWRETPEVRAAEARLAAVEGAGMGRS